MDKKNDQISQSSSQPQLIIPISNQEPKKIVCDVCGYANPDYTAQCKKCSNYLKRS